MKTNISKILGVGLTLVLLASSIVVPTPKPAVAATLEWSAMRLPSPAGGKTRGISSVLPSIIAVSPDGKTIFATHSTNGTVYRSTNGGVTFGQTAGTGTPGWNDGVATTYSFGGQVRLGANVRLTAIGVSPTFATDKTVVAATAAMSGGLPNAGLHKSTDGGVNFTQLTSNLTSGEYFTSISLSPTYSTDGLLVAATSSGIPPALTWTGQTATFGNVYQFGKTGTFGLNAIVPAAGRDFYAVAFSPNYAGDRTIIAVGADATDTRVLVNVNWGTTWGSFTGMADAGDILLGSTNVTLRSAALAVPSDFQGFDTSKRVLYVSRVIAGGTGNVTRTSFGASMTTTADIFPSGEGEIHSLSYRGTITAGTLFAGAQSGTGVFRVTNPNSSTEFSNWIVGDKLPTGTANVTVVAAPDFATSKKVYAMTEGKNGGFAVSTDSGAVFTEFALINTSSNQVKTFVPSPNYDTDKTIFLTTTDNGTADADSVWYSKDGGSSWLRYFSAASANDELIVRLSPAYATDKTVIVAETGAVAVGDYSRVWKSTNGGITWSQLLSSMTTINDVIVEDTNTFYEAGKGKPSGSTSAVATVLKSVGGADFSAAPTFSSSLSGDPFSLSRASNGDILMGTTDGRVYRSTDKGLTYSSLPSTTITGISSPNVAGSNVRVVPDSDYAKNKVIYAVSTAAVAESDPASQGGQVQRLVAGTSTAWEAIAASTSAMILNPFSGIAVSNDGILYLSGSAGATAIRGGVLRSTNPTEKITSANAPRFEIVSTDDGLVTNNVTTSFVRFVGLAVATGKTGNTVFAIDQAISDTFPVGFTNNVTKGTFRVMTYTDTFKVGPTLLTPAVTTKVRSPAVTKVDKATLTWKGITAAGTLIPTYEVQVDTKSDFSAGEPGVIPATAFLGDDITKTTVELTGLEGGKQYFWRVRALTPLVSKWSTTWSFTTALATPGAGITEKVIIPASGATAVSIEAIFNWPEVTDATYEFQIGEDPTFGILLYAATSPINTHKARETLAYNTTYYWRVRSVTATAKSAWTTAIFTTMVKPVPAAPPVTITPPAAPAAPEIVKIEVPVPIPQPIPSYLLWAVIIIGAVLIVAVIVLIVRTRRVS